MRQTALIGDRTGGGNNGRDYRIAVDYAEKDRPTPLIPHNGLPQNHPLANPVSWEKA
ncbi:hypothetical protein [Phyllobacterium phragmitis]|uniref:hypothetical protein n=1 Tax=Phyllobacterium phragmitis TaxID=2670329 RepID=UPI0038B3C1CB